MISIKLNKENNELKEIFIVGHANFDKYGKDIVCASVSSIVITTINAILRIDKNSIKYNDENGVYIKIQKDNETVNKLIDNMLSLLKELQSDYPKTIEFL